MGDFTSAAADSQDGRLKDIAERYVNHFGAPVPGERHTTYCKLCTQFKYICDCDEKVLLAELPDFGLPEEERRNLCNYACKKATGSEIPKELKQILEKMGIKRPYPDLSLEGQGVDRNEVLATGTAEQFWKHYGNPENGLVSRLHYHFVRERFIPRYVVKPFTAKEEAYIRSVIEFAQELTNEVDPESGEIVGVKPAKDISEYMAPYVQPCLDFWEKNRLLAIQSNDDARDEFSHREGEMIFRGGMVDWLCYKGHPTKEQVQRSIIFRTKLCQRMLENKVEDFGEKVNKSYEREQSPRMCVNIFDELPNEFDVIQLQQLALNYNIKTPARAIVYLWKMQGLIEKVGKGKFSKCLNGKILSKMSNVK